MRNIFILSLLLCYFFCAVGQTQNGYVKTRGRIVNGQHIYGKGLVGATVQIKGRNSIVVKSNNGSFSFPVNSKQYVIQSVKKKGYQLVDADAAPKTYSFSSNPIYLVMDIPSQQMEDKLATERKLRRTLSRQLQEREDEIERLKEQNKLTEEQYHKALQDLYAEQVKSQDLVSQMAERYSRIDFDQLDEFNRQVSECIIEGRLTEADSLIKSKGDMKERIALHNKHHEANVQARKSLEDSEAMELKDRDDLAEDCYNQFLIHKLQHHPDSAAFYIEQRALLDITNVDWLYDAACYLKDIGNIDKALTFFLKIHTHYVESGAIDLRHALILETIADFYFEYDKNKSKEYYDLAINAFEEIYPLHTHLIHCYSNYVLVSEMPIYFEEGKNNNAVNMIVGSSSILNRILDAQDVDIDDIYFGSKSVEIVDEVINKKLVNYYENVSNKVDSVHGSKSVIAAKVYMCLGGAYWDCGDFESAKENYNKAEFIINGIDSLHPEKSELYTELANFYNHKGVDTTSAILYYQKAIHFYQELYGKKCPKLSYAYYSLSLIYFNLKNYQLALDYALMQFDLEKHLYGGSDLFTYLHISSIYREMGNYDKALEYLEKYKRIIDQKQSNSYWVAQYYSELGYIYFLNKDYPTALDMLLKKIDIDKIEYGDGHMNIWEDYGKIGSVYLGLHDSNKALGYYLQSLESLKWFGLDDFDDSFELFKKYCNQHNYLKAISYYVKVVEYVQSKKITGASDNAEVILKMIKQGEQSNE